VASAGFGKYLAKTRYNSAGRIAATPQKRVEVGEMVDGGWWTGDGGWWMGDSGRRMEDCGGGQGSGAHSPGAGHDVPLWPLFAAVLP